MFEIAWLGGLVIFAAIPWMRRYGPMGWGIHFGLLIPLLFLPHFFGYAPLTFTSAHPGGGIFHPAVIFSFRGLRWTDLDTTIFQATPMILEPLSQPTGPWMAMTGMGGVGPTAIAVLGLLLGCSVFGIGTAVKRRGVCRRQLSGNSG